MKKFIYLCMAVIISGVMLSSCNSSSVKVDSTGGALEIMVVAQPSVWNDDPVGDTLRSILLEPVPMLNQTEPLFDPFLMPANAFEGTARRYRNIMILKAGEEFVTPAISVAYDVYAKSQIVVEVTAPDYTSMAEYMSSHRKEIQHVFNMAESDRFLAQAQKFASKEIGQQIRDKFGFDMNVPKSYDVRDSSDSFMWISQEMPLSSLGIVIYSYPYTGKEDFEQPNLLKRRNEFVARIPGPVDGSYMTTSTAIDPVVSYMRINGRFWAKMQGFWDVEGDIMGGPFVSFSTLDVANHRVVCIDDYIYFPNDHKRNYLRQLESFIRSVKFPGDVETAEAEQAVEATEAAEVESSL